MRDDICDQKWISQFPWFTIRVAGCRTSGKQFCNFIIDRVSDFCNRHCELQKYKTKKWDFIHENIFRHLQSTFAGCELRKTKTDNTKENSTSAIWIYGLQIMGKHFFKALKKNELHYPCYVLRNAGCTEGKIKSKNISSIIRKTKKNMGLKKIY